MAISKFYSTLAVLTLILFAGCAGFITPNPAGIRPSAKIKKETSNNNESEKSEDESVKDVQKTLDSTTAVKEVNKTTVEVRDEGDAEKLDFGDVFKDEYEEEARAAKKSDPCIVETKKVRIELYRNRTKLSGTIKGIAPVVYKNQKKTYSLKGKIRILSGGPKGTLRLETSNSRFLAHLPCTLSTANANTQFAFGTNKYAGGMIITKGKGTSFNVVNYLTVEEYLRGVVPLELGQRDIKYIEAVKAQAVAARTYTYMKIAARRDNEYDLLPTVADQVYGGVGVAYSVGDKAIRETEDIVAVYKGKLINAYYHSTCGGRTANIADVWNKKGFPYLRSVSDKTSNGSAYCSASNYYRWKESWSGSSLSTILKKYSKSAFPKSAAIKGNVRSMAVKGSYDCGRASVCVIGTSHDNYKFGGDKIRFLLRRNIKGYPILRSSSFQVVSADNNHVKISGRGYGHGVGLCQFGALGRAESKQTYQTILKAYYSDINLSAVALKN